jgi:hypothetical protein
LNAPFIIGATSPTAPEPLLIYVSTFLSSPLRSTWELARYVIDDVEKAEAPDRREPIGI